MFRFYTFEQHRVFDRRFPATHAEVLTSPRPLHARSAVARINFQAFRFTHRQRRLPHIHSRLGLFILQPNNLATNEVFPRLFADRIKTSLSEFLRRLCDFSLLAHLVWLEHRNTKNVVQTPDNVVPERTSTKYVHTQLKIQYGSLPKRGPVFNIFGTGFGLPEPERGSIKQHGTNSFSRQSY